MKCGKAILKLLLTFLVFYAIIVQIHYVEWIFTEEATAMLNLTNEKYTQS